MKNPQLQSLTVGDLLWLPNFGNQSPMWLVTGFGETHGIVFSHEVVDLLELEDCHTLTVAMEALNEHARIL